MIVSCNQNSKSVSEKFQIKNTPKVTHLVLPLFLQILISKMKNFQEFSNWRTKKKDAQNDKVTSFYSIITNDFNTIDGDSKDVKIRSKNQLSNWNQQYFVVNSSINNNSIFELNSILDFLEY
jgi:hypothetical protein